VNGIPLVDLAWQHAEVDDEVRAGIDATFRDLDFVGGKAVAEFEREYADFLGSAHCIGVANGTDALELALRALDVGRGHDVVLPANTFIATAEAVVRAGARPVLADVDEDHLLLAPDAAAAALTPATRAVVAVHLYGQPAPVERIRAAVGPDVVVVEDAAQSQGARRFGQSAGTLGTVAGTSFYPGKNLGAYGDAGAVLTDDAEVARRVRLLANHGSDVRYRHELIGFNSRLDTIQAVVLLAKLRRLAQWNRLRSEAAVRYDALLADVPEVRRPRVLDGNDHVWHLYVVRVANRDDVLAHLHTEGIGAAVHYPVPVHLQPAFRDLGAGTGRHPVAERAAAEILSLPIHPGITPAEQERVVDALRKAVRA